MQVGTTGDGSTASSAMTTPVTTGSDGSFTLSQKFSCTNSANEVYLLALQGNSSQSSSPNPQLAMMTAIGPCSSLTNGLHIAVNELTTVASVASLLPYITGANNVGSGTSDAASLAAAMNNVSEYVNTATGLTPGTSLPNGSTAPTATLISLANVIAACINTGGGTANDGSACGTLFSYTTSPSGAYPTDTIQALVDILTDPANQAGLLFGLVPPTPPYGGGLTQAPSNWALPILLSNSTSVSFANATYSANESAGTVTLYVAPSAAGPAATVNYTTVSGSAIAGQDYPTTTGTLTWPNGSNASQSIQIPLYNPGHAGGTRSFTVALNDPAAVSLGSIASTQITLAENDTALTVGSTASAGTQYLVYNAMLPASGGVGNLTWTLTGGTLPTGMSLASTGQLSGTPTNSGNFSFGVQVQDSATPTPQTVTQTITLQVTALSTAVSALPTSTPAEKIKNAVLSWGLSGAASLATEGNSSASTALYEDVANALSTTFTVPSTLPAAYYPTIPSIATNPMVTAANSSIASELSTDGTSPLPWDNQGITLAPGTAADYLTEAQNMMTALLTPGQTYYENAALVPSILNRLEDAAYLVQTSDYADIDTDSELPYLYLMISQGWSQLLLPSRAAAWQSTIAQNTSYEINGNTSLGLTAYGPYFISASTNSNVANWWINSDVRHIMAIEFGGLVAGNANAYASYIAGGLHEMQAVIMPDGGTDYTDQQNEAFTYHDIYVTQLARYTQVTGDTTGTTLAAKTQYYNPLTVIPPIGGEYITAPSWKKYWNEVLSNDASAVVVGLTGDPYNLTIIQNAGWPASYFCAQYYNSSVTALALPTNWITYDQNAQGPRGIQGDFVYVGTTRTTPLSSRGKPTYVGAVSLNQTTDVSSAGNSNNYSLNAALESAGSLILTASGGELVSKSNSGATEVMANEAQQEHNASTTYGQASSSTTYFGAVSTTHALSGYEQTASGWTENEAWVLLPTRVIGLVNVANTAGKALTACEVDGGFKLVSGRDSWGTAKSWSTPATNVWQYGNMVVDLFATDYTSNHLASSSSNPALYRTELTGTWEDDSNKAGWLILEDANNQPTDTSLTAPASTCVNASGAKVTGYSYPANYSHYFLADFRQFTSAMASSVSQLTGLTSGLIGFTFVDGSTTYTMVANTTGSAVSYTPPSGATVVMSGNESRATWIDPTCSACVTGATYSGTVPAYSHIVAFH